MTITLYGIANCDTVKKTKQLLDSKKIAYDFYDFKKQPPSKEMLKRWLNEFGAEQVINKRGTTWRKLDEKTQALAGGSESQQIKLLLENSSMIKRPIIEIEKNKTRGKSIIGFDKEAIDTAIKNL